MVTDPLFACEGEMARRMASHDWAATPLGPVEMWPQSLRTTVSIMLRSRYAMVLSWGEQFVMLYNDAYIPTLGAKHPNALGGQLAEEFAEIWDSIGPMQRSVLAGGTATWDEDLSLTIERGTGPEETFFTFSYSHVPDDTGPGGVLAVLSITTDKVVAARRLSLLNELAFSATRALSPGEAVSAALAVLSGATRDIQGAAVYRPEVDETSRRLVRAGACGTCDGVLLPAVLEDPTHPVFAAWVEDRIVTEPNDFGAEDVILPIRSLEADNGVLVLRPNPLRPLNEDHQRFAALVADRLGQSLTAATARARELARLEAMAALDEAKTAFLSNISHEFRTPLTLLLGPLEDVLTGREDTLDRVDLEVMHQSAHRLLRMVNGLLDVAVIEADGLQAHLEATDLTGLTADLLRPFGSAARRAGLTLHVMSDPTLTSVMVDPGLWEKIVLNLVGNAIKFTSTGTVSVALSQTEQGVLLQVIDTGSGIPEKEVDHVFERFFRSEDGERRSIEGTGLGLAIVADAARAMEGWATVRSEVGSGSTFEVSLPLIRSDTPAPTPRQRDLAAGLALALEVADTPDHVIESTTQTGEEAAGRSSILVVEDNAALRARVVRLLSGLGRVSAAPNGRLALDFLERNHVDLVVTDAMMPVVNGMDLLRAIRADDSLRRTPVLMLSARAGSDAAVRAMEAGADDYVVKPFTPEELLARCRTTIELAQSRATAAASEVRSTLLAGVSHDMQTPLAVVAATLQMLGDESLGAADRARMIDRASTRTAQLASLVSQFLDWTRLSVNQPLPVRIEAVDVGELIQSVVAGHPNLAPPDLDIQAEACCDIQRTERILHNLLDNAARYSTAPPRLEIAADVDLLSIRVLDDGSGIDPEVLPHLFEAFSPTTSLGGHGLGLYVSRQAARAQGGDLILESTGASGSVFTLRVRLAELR